PLILTLARGHYWPKEHQQHLQLAAFYPQVAVAYTQIVTISTDDHHTLQEFRASVGAQWTFLSDPERTVQKDLEIQEYTDPEHNPMIPHTLVLKPGLVIHSIYNGYWFWGRPSVEDLRRDLRGVTSEIRPDWDLSAPDSARPGKRAAYRTFTGGINEVGSRPRRCEPSMPSRARPRTNNSPAPGTVAGQSARSGVAAAEQGHFTELSDRTRHFHARRIASTQRAELRSGAACALCRNTGGLR